jgi:hypothetical protein
VFLPGRALRDFFAPLAKTALLKAARTPDKSQGQQMGGNAKVQFYASPISNHCFMFCEIDLDIVVVEKNLIEICNRLEDGFLRYEKKPSTIDGSVQ